MKRTITLALALLCAGVAVAQWTVGYSNSGYSSRGAAYDAGGAANREIRVLSRTTTFPNSAAVAAGYVEADSSYYTHYNKGAAGEAVRWGYFYKGSPDSVYYAPTANNDYRIMTTAISVEDDIVWQSVSFFGFLWFDCTGLEPGMKVRSSGFVANAGLFASQIVNAGCFLAARLDTNSADYGMLTGNSAGRFANNDAARFDVTFNKLDKGAGTDWSPTLANRDDRHDFGPRSNNVIGPGTYTTGTAIYFDMTDAVQLACDMAIETPAILTRGFLVHVYGFIPVSGTARNFEFCAGNYPGIGTSGKGNPVFVAEGTTLRGPQRWDGIPAPVIAIFDDVYSQQVDYAHAMFDSGLAFDVAPYRNGMFLRAWVDSMEATGANANYLMHSRTHASLGGLTGAALDPEITRKWALEEFSTFTATDTLGLLDYAWPAGGGTPNTSIEALSRLIDFGFRSSRGTQVNWTATEVAMSHDTWLSWDGFVNLYMIAAPNAGIVFEVGGAEANAAQMADSLDDLIDQAATDYGHAPVILYGHNYAMDHISGDNLRTFIGLVNARPHAGFMSYNDALAMRLAGEPFLAPGDIAEWTSAGVYAPVMTGAGIDSNMIQTMAAQQDSVYEADANANLLQMWIGPK